MKLAIFKAQEWSKDETKIGAVVIDPVTRAERSLGYNGFPRGTDDTLPERQERPMKYLWACHAEENSLWNALLNGVSVRGCTLYVNSFPCCPCTRGIVQSGIKRLVAFEPNFDDPRWGEEYRQAIKMMAEAGIAVTTLRRIDFPGQELSSRVLLTSPDPGAGPQR
jgi:dCMP deaminase